MWRESRPLVESRHEQPTVPVYGLAPGETAQMDSHVFSADLSQVAYRTGERGCVVRLQDRFGHWGKFNLTFTER
jgi:hypothetical protein